MISKFDKYEVLDVLGQGSFGLVRLVKDKSRGGKTCAMKLLDFSTMAKEAMEAAIKEVDMLSQLHHPNIVAYYESFMNDSHQFCIVMEYCGGGDCAKTIKKLVDSGAFLDEKSAMIIFVQIAMAIQYIHKFRLLHRDLKPANIYLSSENIVKLGDFGISKALNSGVDLSSTVIGTPYSMCPEICKSIPYSFAADIWGLGCVFYELLTLRKAFEGQNLMKLVWNIVETEPEPLPNRYSSDVQTLINLMFKKDPNERPSIDEILRLPFLFPYIAMVNQLHNPKRLSAEKRVTLRDHITALTNTSSLENSPKSARGMPDPIVLESQKSTKSAKPSPPSSPKPTGRVSVESFTPASVSLGSYKSKNDKSGMTLHYGSDHGHVRMTVPSRENIVGSSTDLDLPLNIPHVRPGQSRSFTDLTPSSADLGELRKAKSAMIPDISDPVRIRGNTASDKRKSGKLADILSKPLVKDSCITNPLSPISVSDTVVFRKVANPLSPEVSGMTPVHVDIPAETLSSKSRSASPRSASRSDADSSQLENYPVVTRIRDPKRWSGNKPLAISLSQMSSNFSAPTPAKNLLDSMLSPKNSFTSSSRPVASPDQLVKQYSTESASSPNTEIITSDERKVLFSPHMITHVEPATVGYFDTPTITREKNLESKRQSGKLPAGLFSTQKVISSSSSPCATPTDITSPARAFDTTHRRIVTTTSAGDVSSLLSPGFASPLKISNVVRLGSKASSLRNDSDNDEIRRSEFEHDQMMKHALKR